MTTPEHARPSAAEAALARKLAGVTPDGSGERLTAEPRERASKRRADVYAITVYGEDGRVPAEMQGLSRAIGGPAINGTEPE